MARRAGSDGTRTEAAIRDAALTLIARHGYEALSMRRLAEEVGLGAAALYRYFPTKQAILFRLLESHMTELLAAWAAEPRGRMPLERLERFTRFHIRHHLPRADGVFLSYMELRSLSPENFAVVEEKRRIYEADLTAILAEGRSAGAFRVEHPRIASRAIIALLTGITTWYRREGPVDPQMLEDLYWNMVRRLAGAEARHGLSLRSA